jgi:hypothetical protein
MIRLALLAVVPLSLLLAACAVMPIGSLLPLARIDLMTTDLDRMRVALRLPPSLRPRPTGVQMDVVLRVNGQPDQTTSLVLVETRDPADLAGLPSAGAGVYVYRLTPEGVAGFTAIRKALADLQAARRQGSLGLGIATREFCALATVPAGPMRSSSYLMTSENSGYVTLLEGFDLRSDPKLADAFAMLQPC